MLFNNAYITVSLHIFFYLTSFYKSGEKKTTLNAHLTFRRMFCISRWPHRVSLLSAKNKKSEAAEGTASPKLENYGVLSVDSGQPQNMCACLHSAK